MLPLKSEHPTQWSYQSISAFLSPIPSPRHNPLLLFDSSLKNQRSSSHSKKLWTPSLSLLSTVRRWSFWLRICADLILPLGQNWKLRISNFHQIQSDRLTWALLWGLIPLKAFYQKSLGTTEGTPSSTSDKSNHLLSKFYHLLCGKCSSEINAYSKLEKSAKV